MRGRYDILVIGGGIHGAGIAQAAALAGYSVLLVEKNDWGSGTSSKSSKLIHGGLRYLQSRQFRLVRESLQERELLLRNAPELVHRKVFYLPVYEHSRYAPWQIQLALMMYWGLSGFRSENRFQRLATSEWADLDGLKIEGLRAVFRYSDAQTDDLALTRAVVQSAVKLGATVRSSAEFLRADWQTNHFISDIRCDAGIEQVESRFLVNASGHWANQLVEKMSPTPPKIEMDWVQGAHIELAEQLSKHCFYLESPSDHRMVFCLPWKDRTLVGTTETLISGDPDAIQPLDSEVVYLRSVLRHYFPHCRDEPINVWAGVRVLPRSERTPFARSREVQFAQNEHYLCVYGGKLTGYRATAEQVMQRIEKALGEKTGVQRSTKDLPLFPV